MKPFVLLLSLSILSAPLLAQTPGTPATSTTTSTPLPIPMWRCQLPGGVYEVKLGSINAVSQHEYLVDGVARVTEVNVDTDGVLLARFYFLEPAPPNVPVGADAVKKAQELLTEAADRAGQDAWKKVVKSHPATTHARTVEYRLTSKDQVQKLFESLETAFRTGKGAAFSAE